MTVFVSRVRRAYVRRRSLREMAIATLLMVAAVALLAIAACEELERPAEPVGLTAAQRAEIVRSWYGELYPQYVVRR